MSQALIRILFLGFLSLTLAACGQAPLPPAESAEDMTVVTPSDAPRDPAQVQSPGPAGSDVASAPAEAPDGPDSLYMSDLIRMTTGDIFDLWGPDITYFDDWYFGASKYFYYEDGRVPYTFSFRDLDFKGTAEGSEPLLTVSYYARENADVSYAAPGFPISVTYPQLLELAPEGEYCEEIGEWDEIHEGASSYFVIKLDADTEMTYLWLEGRDASRDPADTVTLTAIS